MVYPNTLPILFLNVKLVTILEIEIRHFFIAEQKVLKIHFSHILFKAWYSLDPSIINSNSSEIFKSKLLAFMRLVQRSIYNVFNPQGLKFLTRLRLGLSHLNEHRLKHNFKGCINPLCFCSLEVENTLHFFLHCHHYSTFRMGLMNKVNQIDENFSYFTVTQDLMTIKTVSSYQPQLLIF